MKSVSDVLHEKYLLHFSGVTIPEKIIINKKKLMGTAFFPGGDGVFKECGETGKSFPIMVLGQDFDNEVNFNCLFNTKHQSEVIGCKRPNSTWNKLLGTNKKTEVYNGILRNDDYSVQINPKDCFFTNAILGLRKGNESNHKGKSVAFLKSNEIFLSKNIEFFKLQLRMIKPKLIIGLGATIPNFIGRTFTNEKYIDRLVGIDSFKKLDELSLPNNMVKVGIENLGFESESPIYIVFVTHPCLYVSNYKRREINKNENVELKSIKIALDKIGYSAF